MVSFVYESLLDLSITEAHIATLPPWKLNDQEIIAPILKYLQMETMQTKLISLSIFLQKKY